RASRPFSRITRVPWPMSFDTSLSVPTATIRSPRAARASATGRFGSTVTTLPPRRTRSASAAPAAAGRRAPARTVVSQRAVVRMSAVSVSRCLLLFYRQPGPRPPERAFQQPQLRGQVVPALGVPIDGHRDAALPRAVKEALHLRGHVELVPGPVAHVQV